MPTFIDRLRNAFTHQTPATTVQTPTNTTTPQVDVKVTTPPVTAPKSNATNADPVIDAAVRVANVAPKASKEVEAVKTLRALIKNNQLNEYYDAAIGIGKPELKDKAIALFESLPKVTGATQAEDLVGLGLWTTAPRGIAEMQKTARYLPGRQLMVETTVNPDIENNSVFLTYKEGGTKAVTHRATLVGEDGNNFKVKIDGKAEPITVSKESVYFLNQPNQFEVKNRDGSLDYDHLIYDLYNGGLSKKVDYNDKFLKAKVCEAAIKMDELVGRLDFSQVTASGGGMISRFSTQKTVEVQRACVKVVHDVINMQYPDHSGSAHANNDPGRVDDLEAGRSAIKGWGVCDQQASTMLAVLNPFTRFLGVDVKMYYGGCYRNWKQGQDPFESTRSAPHSWLQLDYRPSMERRICDRTWCQSDKDADSAYSRWGDRYPNRGWFRPPVVPVSKTDIDCTGKISVETFDRQFGQQGVDGRVKHQ